MSTNWEVVMENYGSAALLLLLNEGYEPFAAIELNGYPKVLLRKPL